MRKNIIYISGAVAVSAAVVGVLSLQRAALSAHYGKAAQVIRPADNPQAKIVEISSPEKPAKIATDFFSRPRKTNFNETLARARNTSSTAHQTTSAPKERTPADPTDAYLDTMLAKAEQEGKDNALLHLALALKLAPDTPTEKQLEMINYVLDHGWDEKSIGLLPYLQEWLPAFEELQAGALVDYASGPAGSDTTVPNFLKAQIAAKMLAVYSQYLESQGQNNEALQALQVVIKTGGNLQSPDNYLISDLVGIAMQNIGLKALDQIINQSSPSTSWENMQAALNAAYNAQPSMRTVMEGEMRFVVDGSKKLPPEISEDFLGQVAKFYEDANRFFEKPYWERGDTPAPTSDMAPRFDESEARLLITSSKLRQQEINIAVQRYISRNGAPPPDLQTLVNQGMLKNIPRDPFTGQDFTYGRTGNGYQLYGSGPNIKTPNDPRKDYSPSNGTFSEGVIRIR